MFHIRSFYGKVCLSLTEPCQTSKMRRFAKLSTIRPDQLSFSFCGRNMEKSRCGRAQQK